MEENKTRDIADFEAKIAAATRDELLECMRARTDDDESMTAADGAADADAP